MTKSFTQILARHRGPYRLQVSLAPEVAGAKGAKGRWSSQWMPEKTKDPVTDALAILQQMGGAAGCVQVWSEYEQQFAFGVEEIDRAVWTAEAPTQVEVVKALRKAVVTVPITKPADATPRQVARVLELRATGLGYVHIETEVLGAGNEKKGFFAWRICKVEAVRTEK